MKPIKRTVVYAILAVLTVSCSKQPQEPVAGQTVGDVATNIVQRAQADDTNYFIGFLGSTAKDQAPQLIDMIQRSGILTNYAGHLRKDSLTQGRLDYHAPESQCHFQVDLQQEGADWKVRRIYFCR